MQALFEVLERSWPVIAGGNQLVVGLLVCLECWPELLLLQCRLQGLDVGLEFSG